MADELAEAEKKTMADSETARKSRQRCEARAFRTLPRASSLHSARARFSTSDVLATSGPGSVASRFRQL